ncbi:hypothetical protein SAMN05192556_103252 [Halomonas caseinilytica]|uniref:Uncharacterized protein n=1 Tax=Halomonas caseinilytica TaxID=438744 RepID=A0A1M6T8Z1_9GAMM|nr:hypothetical protein SAMN05192556_103252 [Halomonas caseinilytica]
MGMAATAIQGSDVDYQRIGIWTLRELARQSHEDHDPDAARVFVSRILDIEVERRTVHDHHNQGWHSHSPCAPGLAPGGTAIAREPLAALYDRGIYTHEQHEAARRWIESAGIKPRQLLAALIQAAKLHPRAVSNTPWTKSYDHIAEHIDWYAKALGFVAVPGTQSRTVVREVHRQHRNRLHVWPMPADRVDAELARVEAAGQPRKVEEQQEERVPVFKDGNALKSTARRGRAELMLLASI